MNRKIRKSRILIPVVIVSLVLGLNAIPTTVVDNAKTSTTAAGTFSPTPRPTPTPKPTPPVVLPTQTPETGTGDAILPPETVAPTSTPTPAPGIVPTAKPSPAPIISPAPITSPTPGLPEIGSEYHITYYMDGGWFYSSANIQRDYKYGTGMSSLPIPHKTDCYFLGWFDNQVGGKLINSISPDTYGNLNLYAGWKKLDLKLSRESPITLKGPSATTTIEVKSLTEGDEIKSVSSSNTDIVKVSKIGENRYKLSTNTQIGECKVVFMTKLGAKKRVNVVAKAGVELESKSAVIMAGSRYTIKLKSLPKDKYKITECKLLNSGDYKRKPVMILKNGQILGANSDTSGKLKVITSFHGACFQFLVKVAAPGEI